jgi:hypothetical protein
VEFWLHNGISWEKLTQISESPYQFQFDSDELLQNQQYPIEAYAYDRAGNQNRTSPDDFRQVIYIIRIIRKLFYLPLTLK